VPSADKSPSLLIRLVWTSSLVAAAIVLAKPGGAAEQAEEQRAQWLTSTQYQQVFNEQVREGRYPKTVEGRCENGSEQFRADWGRIPSGAGFYSHHALTKALYEARNGEYVSHGYSLQSITNFEDCSGVERYQATWINTSGPLRVASSIAPDCVLKPIETPAATYPQKLRRAHIEGVVNLQFRVLPDGSVSDVRAVPPSHKDLIPTALQTVEKWRFEPHACGGDFGVVMQSSMNFHFE